MSAATARYGSASLSKSLTAATENVCFFSSNPSFCPAMKPRGSLKPFLKPTPNSMSIKLSRSRFLRKLSQSCEGQSANRSVQLISWKIWSISAGELPDGVEPADDGAHARADHEVHRHAVLLEDLEDADVGRAARAAAAEDQADLRARALLRPAATREGETGRESEDSSERSSGWYQDEVSPRVAPSPIVLRHSAPSRFMFVLRCSTMML